MYQIVGGVRSRAVRVLWLLEELELPYEFIPAGPRSQEVRALNPAGKVPVLVSDKTVLTDSSAILAHLADKHGKFTFPAGSLDRARQDGALHKTLDEIDAVLWTAARHSFVLPEDQRVPKIKDTLRWEFAHNLPDFATLIGDGPYIMGEAFTFADIVLCHCLGWAINVRFPVEDETLRAYNTRCRARPAFRRAVEQ